LRSKLARFTCETIALRLAVIAPTSRRSWPVSSPPRMSIVPLRSPCATRREAATASPIRPVILVASQPSRPRIVAIPAAAIPADVSSGPRTRPTRSDVGICMTTVQPPDGTLAAA
jgi:hypothetical protein